MVRQYPSKYLGSAMVLVVAIMTVCAGAPRARAADGLGKETDIRHRFIACCFNNGKIIIIDEDGRWERVITGAGNVQDAWMLRNGNILYSHYGGAREVAPDDRVVWEYRTERPHEVECHSAQPLPNGNVLVGESGRSRLVEVDRAGRIAKRIPVRTNSREKHTQFRTCRKTPKGTYLVGCMGDGVFREVDGKGREIRVLVPGHRPKKNGAHGVVQLPDGHILATTGYGKSYVEFDENGNVIWSVSQRDLPAKYRLDYTCSAQRLPNGNTLVGTYRGRPQFLELTPDKKVVWSYRHEGLGEVSGILWLDMPDPVRGEVHR